MAMVQAALVALAVLSAPAQARDGSEDPFKSSEATVPPSYWIDKACSGQAVRFSVTGTQTDRALNEFGTAMQLPTPKIPDANTPPRTLRGYELAGKDETFGQSPSEPVAEASWDYSNDNPREGDSCRQKLSKYAQRYGDRLKFSNAPTGFFAEFFGAKKPFSKTVAKRLQALGKSGISSSGLSSGLHFDGGGLQTPADDGTVSSNWLSDVFGSNTQSLPRAQMPVGRRGLDSGSVPGPALSAPEKSYTQRAIDWGSKQVDDGVEAVKGAFGSIAGGITENINKIQGFFATSGTGGKFVRPYTRRIMEAWHKFYGNKIQITSASRYSQSGYRDYSDVHKGHKQGLTLDVGSKGPAENAKMLHALYQAGAPVSRMLHTHNAAVIAAAGKQYGTNSTYVQWLKRKLIYYKGHTGHIDVKFI